MWFLRECLRRFQTLAVLLALILATSFTVYGVIRSRIVVGGMPGLFIETLILLPLAAGYAFWLMADGRAAFGTGDPSLSGLLTLAGPLTALPLLFFALAARRLRLSTIGFLQFIAPTLQFLMGLFYGERLLCFAVNQRATAGSYKAGAGPDGPLIEERQ